MVESKNGADKAAEPHMGATAIKPETKEGFAGFLEFLYNKKNGTVLGRTGKSWALITLFYIVYYSCLAAFWAAMLTVFMTTIEDDRPKWQTKESMIGDKPGIGFRPSQSPESVGSTVIYLNNKWDGTIEGTEKDDFNAGYAYRLREFLKKYDEKKSEFAVACPTDEPDQKLGEADNFCEFDLATLGECKQYPYGYAADGVGGNPSPCIFLKLNRIFGLQPEPYKKEDLPEDTPKHISDIVDAQGGDNKPFVDCQGEYPADIEALEGNMKYFPSDQSISMKFFPMKTKKQNQNALVALKLNNLPTGQLVQIICKVYYKGVKHEKKTKSGLVQFQVFVNPKQE